MYQMLNQMQPQKQNNGTPNFNQQQFKNWLPNLNQSMLNQLVSQARAQGIPENEIQAGLQIINQFK